MGFFVVRRKACSNSCKDYSAFITTIMSLIFLIRLNAESVESTKINNSPDGLRHIRPRYILDIGGVFLFLLVVPMTDKVQAKQDLEFCSAELSKYQNLSRSGLTRAEMLTIDGIMIKLKERIKNLREALYA